LKNIKGQTYFRFWQQSLSYAWPEGDTTEEEEEHVPKDVPEPSCYTTNQELSNISTT
jgi:hypothetical protein